MLQSVYMPDMSDSCYQAATNIAFVYICLKGNYHFLGSGEFLQNKNGKNFLFLI